MQKHVNLVDLVKSFPTNIYLQNLASIQKRTSPVKFAHFAEKSGKGSISNLSTKETRGQHRHIDASLRYIADVFMQNVTTIRGGGFEFRNIGRLNLTKFNVVHCFVGAQILCMKDYGHHWDYAMDEWNYDWNDHGNQTGCTTTGQISGAMALNSVGDLVLGKIWTNLMMDKDEKGKRTDAPAHVDYKPRRLFVNSVV